jgi:hypothetical protein
MLSASSHRRVTPACEQGASGEASGGAEAARAAHLGVEPVCGLRHRTHGAALELEGLLHVGEVAQPAQHARERVGGHKAAQHDRGDLAPLQSAERVRMRSQQLLNA